jgi:hypothetical protein
MPIPKDITFSALTAKIDRAVAREQKSAVAREEKGSSDPAAAALSAALVARKTLDTVMSTTPQLLDYRARFGVEWSDRFIQVSTFSKQAFFGLEGKALVEHLWRKLPNSRFKRFQETFCEPTDYAIPKPNLEVPCVEYPSRETLNTCALTGCLVSPARIPFKLLVDLGIVPKPDTKLTDLEALAIKAQPSVIQTLKAVFESTELLAGQNPRFTIVRSPSQATARAYPKAKALPESCTGALIYTRENVAIDRSSVKNQRSPWVAPQLIPAFFANVYSARRKTEHQTATYKLETTTIGSLALEWNELNARARHEWRRAAPQEVKQDIRDALVRLVGRSREELRSVEHHLKQQAAKSFEALEERLNNGSNNITTHITTVNAAVTRLEKRLSTMPYKSGHNTVDGDQLTQAIEKGERALDLIRKSLFPAGCRLRDEINRRDSFFTQRGLSEGERTRQAHVLLSRMDIPFAALNEVPAVRPFRAFAAAHKAVLSELRSSVLSQDAKQAQQAMVKLVVFSKLQRANAIFEKLRSLTSGSQAVPLKEIRQHASSLSSLLEMRSVFPHTTAPQFQPVYEGLQRKVRAMANRLNEYHSQGLDLDERSQMYSRLRAYLDKTDLEKVTNELLAMGARTT